MKRKKSKPEEEPEEEIEEGDEELDEKELKKKKREEAAEKRRKVRKQDKAARWSGIILLTVIMIIGFLMWVSGEVKNGSSPSQAIPTQNNSYQQSSPLNPQGKVIVR